MEVLLFVIKLFKNHLAYQPINKYTVVCLQTKKMYGMYNCICIIIYMYVCINRTNLFLVKLSLFYF